MVGRRSAPAAVELQHKVSRSALSKALGDIASDGEISYDRLKKLLCSTGAGINDAGANSIMTALVRMNYTRSSASVEDIVSLLVPTSQVESFDELNVRESAEITRKFASIDKDGDGSIETDDLELATARLGPLVTPRSGAAASQTSSSGLSALQKAQIAARVEGQGDGRVGLSEFFNILRDVDRPTGPPPAKLLDGCIAAFDKQKAGALTRERVRCRSSLCRVAPRCICLRVSSPKLSATPCAHAVSLACRSLSTTMPTHR